MIRLLILSIIIFLLYIGFVSISVYDSPAEFVFLNYHIETTLFSAFALSAVLTLTLFTIFKVVFLIFDIPAIIRERIRKNKLQKLSERSLRAFSELLMGNKQKAFEIINKISPDIALDNSEVTYLVNFQTETSFDKKIHTLRNLLNRKNYSIYAAKTLAQIFFDNAHYQEAEEYAIKAFNENDTDIEIMVLLIRIYAKLGLWPKLVFVVAKLQRADTKLLKVMRDEIAKYYYMASKNSLAAGDDAEAIKYLESSLELKPDCIEALTLFTEIKAATGHASEVTKILKSAYSLSPCFQIAELLIKTLNSGSESTYTTLASIADPKEYLDLYLAVAAYLNLPNRLAELRAITQASHDIGH